jgi:hypothetical protein
MEEEIEFGPFEVTIHELVSLVERASERILTLADLGIKGIEPQTQEMKDETFKECIIFHMTAKVARPNLEQLRDLAARLDRMSVALPDIGTYGKQLAEEMNLASSRIRRMIMDEVDENGEPLS